MPDFRQRLILFKPMRPGVSGCAIAERAGSAAGAANARGLEAESVQAYWYGAGGEAWLMGATRVNAHGEASPHGRASWDALAPERLQAVLLLSGGAEPVPLMIGLCVQQSAGSLLMPKTPRWPCASGWRHAAGPERSQRLSSRFRAPSQSRPPPALPPPVRPAPQPQVIPVKQPRKRREGTAAGDLLPAIDPLPYVDAARRAMGEELPERNGPQAGRAG